MNESQLSAASVQRTLARVRSLARPQTRQAQRCFWIEGIRNFVQACDANWPLDTVVHCPVLLKSALVRSFVQRLRAAGVRCVRISPEQFRTICTTERASGIGAIARERWTRLGQAQPSRGLCWIVLEEVRSPGNLGTILRTAEACGVAGAIFVGPQCDPFDPTVVRATMGGIFHLPLVRATHEDLSRWVREHRFPLVGLSPDADRLWTELEAAGPVGLAIGEERGGLSDRMRALCHTTVRLPMTGRADSLNVGVAAGVMLYELVRRAQLTS